MARSLDAGRNRWGRYAGSGLAGAPARPARRLLAPFPPGRTSAGRGCAGVVGRVGVAESPYPLVVRALIILTAVLAGGAVASAAEAPSVRTADSAVRIAAIGDYGVGGSMQRSLGASVRRAATQRGLDVLVTLGDNDYTRDPVAFRANWDASFGWLSRRPIAVAGVLGNHDVEIDEGRYVRGALRMPARYYTRRLGDVQLFLLDSTAVDPAQTRWLARALARSRARWRIAVLHHPPYSCGKYGADARVLASWQPLFERRNVRLVLSGHDHNYQRFTPRAGVTYVVHGGGGRGLYDIRPCPGEYPRRAVARAEHGFLYLVVRRTRLEGWAVAFDGTRRDRFVIRARGTATGGG